MCYKETTKDRFREVAVKPSKKKSRAFNREMILGMAFAGAIIIVLLNTVLKG